MGCIINDLPDTRTLKEKILDEIDLNPGIKHKEVAKKLNTSVDYVRKAIYFRKKSLPVKKEIIATENHVLYPTESLRAEQVMVGLIKNGLPMKFRQNLSELIFNIELSIKNRIPDITIQKKKTDKEAAVLLMSDIHAGKTVFDDVGNVLYDKNICVYRISLLKERVLKLLKQYVGGNSRIDEFYLLLIGDLVDGSGIYPQQGLHQDLTNFHDQIALVVAGVWDLICAIRKEFKIKVHVRAVAGNHGRQERYAPAENNFDYLVYQMLKLFAYEHDKNVDVIYSTTAPYLNFEIKGVKMHIRHQAPAQGETPTGAKKFLGWQMMHDFDCICYGHLHHGMIGCSQYADVIMNPSPVGVDDLAERMAVRSIPAQILFGIDPGIKRRSFLYQIYLDKFGDGNEAKKLMGRYPQIQIDKL